MNSLAKAVEKPFAVGADEIAAWLDCTDEEEGQLFEAARQVKAKCGKDAVLRRALIETGNVCERNCLYCGIRAGNVSVSRYRMTESEVGDCISAAVEQGYSAVAFQSGEIQSEENTSFYERVLRALPPGLEVTLSLGEQSEETYRRWKNAAGERVLRYLIRIESSDRRLFAAIHPANVSYDHRLECIRTLKRLGYVTGSGVMIGLPGQTTRQLAEDVVFFGREKLDMVGMGPFIAHPATPLGKESSGTLAFALRMIAATRLYLHEVNIVAATALRVLKPDGIERGLAAGANVMMPERTPEKFRTFYDLYPGKV